MRLRIMFSFLFAILLLFSAKKPEPVIFLVGDSTVKEGSGKGEGELWRWGIICTSNLIRAGFVLRTGRADAGAAGLFRQKDYGKMFWPGSIQVIMGSCNLDTMIGVSSTIPYGREETIRGTGEETMEIDN